MRGKDLDKVKNKRVTKIKFKVKRFLNNDRADKSKLNK